MLRPGQLLYTYLHLAPDPEQTAALVKSGAVCVAYETITGADGDAVLPGAPEMPGLASAMIRWRVWRVWRGTLSEAKPPYRLTLRASASGDAGAARRNRLWSELPFGG